MYTDVKWHLFNPAWEDSSYPLPQPNGRATCLFLHLCAAGLAARLCPHLRQTRGKKGKSEQPCSQRGKMQDGPSFFFPRWQTHAALSEQDSTKHSAAPRDAQLLEEWIPAPFPQQRSSLILSKGQPDTELARTSRVPAGSAGGSAVLWESLSCSLG